MKTKAFEDRKREIDCCCLPRLRHFADDEAPGFPVSPAGAHQEQTLSWNLSFTDKTRVAQYGQKPRWSFPPMRF
jgi:hypothetical protein